MLRLVADENFDGRVFSGLRKRHPAIDLIRAQDTSIAAAKDPDLLAWAADNDRIVLSHDHETMIGFAYARVAVGQKMPGLFMLREEPLIGPAIDEILMIYECSEQEEWKDRVIFLPL